jgi:hypothetical protein
MKALRTILTRTTTSPVFIVSVSFLFSLIYCPPVDVFFDDKEIFSYIGRLIAKGGLPYRDVFDHKPPLIFFFNCFGPWGLWLIDTALVMLATGLFFRLCQKYRLACPWMLPLLFNLLLRNYLVCVSIGMTRAYTAIFLLLFFCLLLNGSKYRYFWMGLLTAATFFMQQDQILTLLPFLFYAFIRSPIHPLIHRPSPTSLSPTGLSPTGPSHSPRNAASGLPPGVTRNLLLAAAGFLTLSAPLIIYFGANQTLGYFWQDAFRFNFSWYTEKLPFMVHFRAVKAGLEASGCMVTFLLAVAAGLAALLLGTTNQRLLTIALLGVLFSFTSEYLSGKLVAGQAFYYYFLPLSATLPILVFTVWTGAREEFLLGKKSQGFYGLLLCCLPFYNVALHATHLSTHNKDLVKFSPELVWLRQQQLKDYELYSFGNDTWIYAYNELDVLSPSRWIYQHFWEIYPRWDAGCRQMESIKSDLLRHRTKYIISDLRTFGWKDPSARTRWLAFLQQHYQPLTPVLWKLK